MFGNILFFFSKYQTLLKLFSFEFEFEFAFKSFKISVVPTNTGIYANILK